MSQLLPFVRESADVVRVYDTATGEALEITAAPTPMLAGIRDQIAGAEDDQRLAKRVIDDELLRRMDREGEWTQHVAGFKLTAPSPAPQVNYDAHALRMDLEAAADKGLVSIDAVDRAVHLVVDYKPRTAGINALTKLGGEVADIIERHRTLAERVRRVSVKRA